MRLMGARAARYTFNGIRYRTTTMYTSNITSSAVGGAFGESY